MDHFFLSLWTFIPLLSLTSCFQFFVNFLFDWLSFFKFLVLNISKIIWIVILSLHMYVTYIFLSTSHLSFTLFFIFSNKSLICWFSLWFLVLFHTEKALHHPTIISLCFIHFLLAVLQCGFFVFVFVFLLPRSLVIWHYFCERHSIEI